MTAEYSILINIQSTHVRKTHKDTVFPQIKNSGQRIAGSQIMAGGMVGMSWSQMQA